MALALISGITGSSGACSDLTIHTQAPPSAPLRPLDAHAVVLEDSVLEATVVVSLAQVIERLEEVAPTRLDRMGDPATPSDPDNSRQWMKLWTDKVDGVRLRSGLERKHLHAEVQGSVLVVEAQYDLSVIAAIPRSGDRLPLLRSCGCQGEPWCGGRTTEEPPRVKLRVETALGVDTNWGLIPATSTAISVDGACELGRDAAGQTIEVMDTVLAPFRAEVEEHVGVIDRELRAIDGLRAKVEQVWRTLEQPIAFDPDTRQLLLRPQHIGLGALSGEGRGVRAPVRFALRPVVTTDAAAAPAPLPAPRSSTEASGLRLPAGIEIGLDPASQPLRKALVGHRFPRRPSRFLRVSDASIYGSPTHAIVRLELEGAAKLEIFVQGRLRLNQEANMIMLEDLELETSSREAIAAFYDVLEHPDLRIERVPWFNENEVIELVQAAARWPITDSVESLREQITQVFRHPVSNRLRLSASIDEIVLMNLWIDQQAIRLAVVAIGELEALPREDFEPDAAPSPDAPVRLHPRLPGKAPQ